MGVSVLFYAQHLLGVGHLARASLIAEALVEQGASVTLVTGGRPVPGFPGPGVKIVQLPPVSAGPDGFSDLVDVDGNPVDDAFRQHRTSKLVETLKACRPDVVLIEAYPFGRRQMRFELEPLLEAAGHIVPRPLIACSVRDILQERTAQKNQRTVDAIDSSFDLVLVHGDQDFANLNETFPQADALGAKLKYTGIVSAGAGRLQDEGYDVVVSAGGGIVGEGLLRAAVEAKQLSSMSAARWCFITGPNLADEVVKELKEKAGPRASFYTSRRDFRALLAGAQLSVSQAGYNTAADILRAGCRSIMVPFSSGGETEQTLRAEKLADRGLVAVIAESDLTPQSLCLAINEKMSMPEDGISHDIATGGAQLSAQILIDRANSS